MEQATAAAAAVIAGAESGPVGAITATTSATPSDQPSGYTAEPYEPKGCYTQDNNTSTADGSACEDSNSELLAGTNLRDEGHQPPALLPAPAAYFALTPLPDVSSEADILTHDVRLLHSASHDDPFSVLGPHFYKDNGGGKLDCIVVRLWRKDVSECSLQPLKGQHFVLADGCNEWVPAKQRSDWLYQVCFRVTFTPEGQAAFREAQQQSAQVTANEFLHRTRFYYTAQVRYHGDQSSTLYEIRDIYNFGLLAPDYDLKFFQQGSCWHVDNLMGSHIVNLEGVEGVRFIVWAPQAQVVSLVGDWNQWEHRANPMRRRLEFGVWELFIPHIGAGQKYGYRIRGSSGNDCIKIDPYAQEFENPPATASIVSSCDDAFKAPEHRFQWTDAGWMRRRAELAKTDQLRRQPMSIYEVHLPSWMRGDNNSYLGYRELAHRLIDHIKKLNFTHVEFLPLAHHPFEGSWGYQISGQYAPYSRLGTPDDLKYLINELHANDIGVFIDFVPAHFVKDSWGLIHYDGGPCYEYADPREGEHKGWGTMLYNFRRNEVRSFLLGAAYHWLRRYHVDGLRIDAVSSMIYKNHCRSDGDWLANEFGGNANLQAISLLQELNWVVHREFPGVFTMAEESTSWPGVTDQKTGLGFDAKWDLGWMNDTLSYLCTPAVERHTKHQKLTFRGLYLGNERWVLPLSHDEVVAGKGSLLDKCGFRGTPFQERLATLKALYGFQVGQPGRPLLFMGAEFGQGREWKESRSLDWHEMQEHPRMQVMAWVQDLFATYREEVALHAGDDESWNFQWSECDNAGDSLVAWIRKHEHWTNDVLVVVNFSGRVYKHYALGVPHGGDWITLLNSDDWKYGGSMVGPGRGVRVKPTQGGRFGWPYCLWLDIPHCGCLMIKAPQMSKEALEEERLRLAATATTTTSTVNAAAAAANTMPSLVASATSAAAAAGDAAIAMAAADNKNVVKEVDGASSTKFWTATAK